MAGVAGIFREKIMNVGEVCSRDVVVANKDESVLDAARLMREYHVGNVVVVEARGEQRVPLGILTDRDIVLELVAKEVDPRNIAVGDAMSDDLLLATEGQQVNEVIQQMWAKGVRRAPVVDAQGGLVGILAVDDLLDLYAEQLSQVAGLVPREGRREQAARP
jgi:CBS domain-containing protein